MPPKSPVNVILNVFELILVSVSTTEIVEASRPIPSDMALAKSLAVLVKFS